MVPSAFQSCNLEGCIQHTDSTCVNLLGLGAHREENIGAVVERDWFQVAWFRRHPRIRLHTNAPPLPLSLEPHSGGRTVVPLFIFLPPSPILAPRFGAVAVGVASRPVILYALIRLHRRRTNVDQDVACVHARVHVDVHQENEQLFVRRACWFVVSSGQ